MRPNQPASVTVLAFLSGLLLALLFSLPVWAGPEETTAGLPDAEDVADVKALDLTANSDPKQRFALIGLDEQQPAPKPGYGLLLVLPGGDGGVDFHAFIKRIHKHAVPKGYLTAQLVAPVWTKAQAESLVWPVEKNTIQQAKFTTEQFIRNVVEEVAGKVKLDRKRVFTLTWSSSGPAGYAASLEQKTPVTGTFVAMSVFKREHLPSLKAAKHHPYFILHSPEDFIPIKFAEDARDQLQQKQAKVQLKTYPGGHGWQGNVYGNIREGLEFLERNAK